MRRFNFLVVLFFYILVFFISLKYGAVHLKGSEIVDALTQKNLEIGDDLYVKRQLVEFRALRFIQASITGSSLALVGSVFQRILYNPIADPYTLGISSGGLFLLSLAIVFNVPSHWGLIPSRVLFCFLGCLFSYFLLSLLMRKLRHSKENTILLGLSMNIFFGSLFVLVCALASPLQSFEIFRWILGSIQETNVYENIWQIVFLIVIFPILFKLHKSINAFAYGTEMAQTSGVPIQSVRMKAILLCSLLVANSVSFCGVIGFVGLVVPHISRQLFMRGGTKMEWSACMLLGALLLSVADVIARAFQPMGEMPVGVIVSLLGSPWLMVTIYRSQK